MYISEVYDSLVLLNKDTYNVYRNVEVDGKDTIYRVYIAEAAYHPYTTNHIEGTGNVAIRKHEWTGFKEGVPFFIKEKNHRKGRLVATGNIVTIDTSAAIGGTTTLATNLTQKNNIEKTLLTAGTYDYMTDGFKYLGSGYIPTDVTPKETKITKQDFIEVNFIPEPAENQLYLSLFQFDPLGKWSAFIMNEPDQHNLDVIGNKILFDNVKRALNNEPVLLNGENEYKKLGEGGDPPKRANHFLQRTFRDKHNSDYAYLDDIKNWNMNALEPYSTMSNVTSDSKKDTIRQLSLLIKNTFYKQRKIDGDYWFYNFDYKGRLIFANFDDFYETPTTFLIPLSDVKEIDAGKYGTLKVEDGNIIIPETEEEDGTGIDTGGGTSDGTGSGTDGGTENNTEEKSKIGLFIGSALALLGLGIFLGKKIKS